MDAIHKIVAWVLSPLGGLFGALILGGLLGAWGRARRSPRLRRTGLVLVVLAAALFWMVSCGFATRLIGLPLELEEVASAEIGEGEKADAIVLLGGGMGVHDRCGRPEIFSSADRAWLAAKLWKAGRAPLMTVSGSGAPAELLFLADMGVETNRVIVLSEARNTEEEARLIRAALVPEGKASAARPRLLLVSSAWHLPRARSLFERAGFSVTPAPADYEMHFAAEAPLRPGDFFPNAEALERNSYALKEWVARACYGVRR